ncbi:hypothetical protein D3C78_1625190 [compost metagenome]
MSQDQAATRTRQGFVGGRRHNVSMWNRVRVNACRNQTGNVRHVNEQVCADAVSDFTHFCPVNHARVSREATDNHLRFVGLSLLRHVFVVNFTRLINAVRDDVVQFA